MEYLKKGNETFKEYYFRLYEDKDKLGLTFGEIGDLLNEVSGNDFSEAKWRRPMQGYKEITEMFGETGLHHDGDDVLQEIEKQKLELEKEKVRMRDQKREMTAIIRKMARLENLEEYLKNNVTPLEPTFQELKPIEHEEEKIAMVILSDWHIGMKIDNKYNKYNKEIAKQRLDKLQQEVFTKIERDGINTLCVAHIGDSIHGHIHTSTRIESEENAIEQLITVAQYMREFIEPFLQKGLDVTFANVAGNHSRIVPNKQDSLGTAESFERLISTFLNTAFEKFENYHQQDDNDGLIVINIHDKIVVLAHGDMDSGNGVITKLNDLLNMSIDYLITGHVHNFFIKEHGKALQIGVGSLGGIDQYALSKRFSGKPSQTYMTFDENGLDEIKPIYFD